jgi:hypothetical protein
VPNHFIGRKKALEQTMELSVIHNTFRSWVQGLQKSGLEACFSHDLEAEGDGQLVVSAVLLTARLDPERRAHGSARRRAPTRPLARLRYLIAVGGSNHHPQTEEALLELMIRAQHAPGMTLATDELSSSWWLACGVAPRPAFMLEACVSEMVEQVPLVQVRGHSLEITGLQSVHGCVVAADATPLPGAEIQLVATGQVVHSNNNGVFHLQVAAPGPGRTHGLIRIRARGVEQSFEIPGPTTTQQPWLIHLEHLGV